MKMLPTQVIEVESEELVVLLGKTVTLFCADDIYTGKLEGVNSNCVKLSSPKIMKNPALWQMAKLPRPRCMSFLRWMRMEGYAPSSRGRKLNQPKKENREAGIVRRMQRMLESCQ